MALALHKRRDKGRALTYGEGDENWDMIEEFFNGMGSVSLNGDGTASYTIPEIAGKTIINLFTNGLRRNSPADYGYGVTDNIIVFTSDIDADTIITINFK